MLSKLPQGDYCPRQRTIRQQTRRRRGDRVRLPLGARTVEFEVLGVYYDYSNERGYVILDRKTLLRYLPDPAPVQPRRLSATACDPEARAPRNRASYCRPRAGDILQPLAARGSAEGLRPYFRHHLGAGSRRDSSGGARHGGRVAGAGDRPPPRGRPAAFPRRVGRTDPAPAAVRSGPARFARQHGGLALGWLLSLVLIYVINKQSFGWTIQFHWPVALLLFALDSSASQPLSPDSTRRACASHESHRGDSRGMRGVLALLAATALAAPAPEFAVARPGYRYRFPRDHYAHPEFRTEWWYWTGNLRDASGRRFGFELTFFRPGRHRAVQPSLPVRGIRPRSTSRISPSAISRDAASTTSSASTAPGPDWRASIRPAIASGTATGKPASIVSAPWPKRSASTCAPARKACR